MGDKYDGGKGQSMVIKHLITGLPFDPYLGLKHFGATTVRKLPFLGVNGY